MFEHETAVFKFGRVYYDGSTADLPEDQLTLVPIPGVKPPIWILGHLAIANDFTLRLLGRPPLCPPRWHVAFGPGSTPLAHQQGAPSKAELIDAFHLGHAAILEALAQAEPPAMAAKFEAPFPVMHSSLQTVGQMVTNLVTVHPALHLGQLSIWRRIQRMPEVIV